MIANNLKKKRGFTLVEMLVAVSILLISVVGPMSLIGDAMHKLYYSKDQLIGINLAQEGIEIVRQTRDSNMLSGVAWDQNLSVGDYVVDIFSAAPISCVSCDQKIYVDASDWYRQGVAGTQTVFSRIVNISAVAVDQIKVTSTVTWKTGGDNGTITVAEYLFKWATP